MLKKAFGRSFLIFAVLAAIIGTTAYFRLGWDGVSEALAVDAGLALMLIPKLGAALLIAAFLRILLPHDALGRLMGDESGAKGLAIASVAGALTPGGPMTSFPLVTVLHKAGTGTAPLISYMTAWTTLGLQRILVWELPLLGVEFAAVRIISAAPLALLAGLLSRFVPIHPDPDATPDPRPSSRTPRVRENEKVEA